MEQQEPWKEMYLVMAVAAADAIEMLEPTPWGIRAGARLSQAMQEAEELYLAAGDGPEA